MLGIVVAIIIPAFSCGCITFKRSTDETNLRRIGRAIIADEAKHPGALTSGDLPDVYALAARLARDGAMTEPKLWFSPLDQAHEVVDLPHSILSPAVAGATAPINPEFQRKALAFAVALFPAGTQFKDLPATTPLAWTRGLLPDGTWSKVEGTYGDYGGHVVFAGGNVQLFTGGIAGRFVKWGTTQPTSNIAEALPPGTRISEFAPTSAKPR